VPEPLLGSGASRDLIALLQRVRGSFLGRCVSRFLLMAGIDRCIVLSSQAFTALIPLLILLATLSSADQSDAAAEAVIRKFALTGDSAAAVEQLFATPAGATSSVSLASALLLLFSGVSFARRMQAMYRAAWGQEQTGIRGGLVAALGLGALLVEVVVLAGVRGFVRDLSLHWIWSVPISIATGLVLWTSIPYLLLNRQVHWHRLVAAGGITAVGTSLFGLATTVYMGPLVTRYTNQFGLFGITIAMIGWLLAAAVLLVSSTAVGAELDTSEGRRLSRVKRRLRWYDPDLPLPVHHEAAGSVGLNSGDILLLLRVLVNWAILAAAVWAATSLLPGIEMLGGVLTYFGVSLVLGLVNAVLGPLLSLVAMPLSVVTLGGSALVVNAVLMAVTAGLTSQLDVDGLGSVILGALVISSVTTVLELVVRPLTPRSG
jgi:uncharacterized membrane protein YvlD (DUF360 family)/uncharacterized BrkB/YihY/UPF0761 family membrane protein